MHNKSFQLTPWVPTPSGRVSGNSTQHLVDAAGQLNSMLYAAKGLSGNNIDKLNCMI
jgi:hypothetical protein